MTPGDHRGVRALEIDRRGLLGALAAAAAFPGAGTAAPGIVHTRGMIDVHAHASVPLYLDHFRTIDTLGSDQAFPYRSFVPTTLPQWSPGLAIEMMERAGIRAQVLSLPDATLELRGATARAFARSINEALATIVAANPARFGAFAVLPHDDVDSTLAEIAYALDVLKLDGVSTTTSIRGAYLGDAAHEPWLNELHRRQAVAFVHPTYPRAVRPPSPTFLEFCYETSRMMTNMVLSGAKRRFGGIRLITAHGGGTVPFIGHRLEVLASLLGPNAPTPDRIHEDLRSFYCDLTTCMSDAPLSAAVDFFGPEKLLVGFDTPYVSAALIAPEVARFRAFTGLDARQKDAIAFGNASTLFPRLAAAQPVSPSATSRRPL